MVEVHPTVCSQSWFAIGCYKGVERHCYSGGTSLTTPKQMGIQYLYLYISSGHDLADPTRKGKHKIKLKECRF